MKYVYIFLMSWFLGGCVQQQATDSSERFSGKEIILIDGVDSVQCLMQPSLTGGKRYWGTLPNRLIDGRFVCFEVK